MEVTWVELGSQRGGVSIDLIHQLHRNIIENAKVVKCGESVTYRIFQWDCPLTYYFVWTRTHYLACLQTRPFKFDCFHFE